MAQEKSWASARIEVHAVYSRVKVISRAIALNRCSKTENVTGSTTRSVSGALRSALLFRIGFLLSERSRGERCFARQGDKRIAALPGNARPRIPRGSDGGGMAAMRTTVRIW